MGHIPNSVNQRRRWVRVVGLVSALVFVSLAVFNFIRPAPLTHAGVGDWSAYLGGDARTNFNAAEIAINATTAPALKMQWAQQARGAISSQIVAANGLLYWGSWDGLEHAANPTTGNDVWTANLGQSPLSCDNRYYGVMSSATIASMVVNGATTPVVFVGGGHADLYALNANSGAVIWHNTTLATYPAQFIYGSPALFNGSVYISISELGDCSTSAGAVVQVSASTGAIQHTFSTVPSGCQGDSVWGSVTIDDANSKVYFATGNQGKCASTETLARSLVELNAADLSLLASWQAQTTTVDSDFGTTPTLFQATINGASRSLVGLANKNGVYYALDRTNLGAGPVWQVQLAIGGPGPEGGDGSISSSAYDGTKLYVAGGHTTIQGAACNGSVQALNPATGQAFWQTCLSSPVLDPVAIVPGVVIVGAGPSMLAFDSAAGKSLFSFHDGSAGSMFWGAPSISNGVLYEGNQDGKLYAFAANGTPSLPGGPVNTTWYFAEGRVGAGFKEFLTLGNPDPVNDCSVNLVYNYVYDTGAAGSKTIAVTVPHASRVTQYVNNDLGIQPTQIPAASLSTDVTVTGPAACKGIVAERPMYFNYHGNTSGSDALGSTKLGTTFYFADVPTGGGYSSFITILNPGKTAATVTAAYYAGGRQVGTQSTNVPPGARGTIFPTNTGLPQHVGAVITSSQPVMVERPSYFTGINGGNAGTVSGAASVVGTQNLGNDWLFAEGYTGTNFQENFVISNLDTKANTTANVTINLEYGNGTKTPFTVSVNPLSQVIWNVNAAGGPTHEVSAEITSSGANVIVQREMFFKYSHTTPQGSVVTATGGTDVIGHVGPAQRSSYSFAEGYSNAGYHEWLTLQNPTATPETIYATLVNGLGRSYTATIPVGANTRATVDITATVAQYLAPQGSAFAAYEVSMTVQTLNNGGVFVAERPMYWNTYLTQSPTPTQGGSDIVGYIGG